ncbi:MAG: TonB family protein [Bacteroidales bacterium]|nr:TonB family protein [Bacteroidales bacterium]
MNVWYTFPINFVIQEVENDTTSVNNIALSNNAKKDENGIYFLCDKMPQFKGGVTELKNHIVSELRYPYDAEELGLSALVSVKFIVNRKGGIDSVCVMNSEDVHILFEREAKRVVLDLPEWIPGEQNGEKVDVWSSIPIGFFIKASEKDETKALNNQIQNSKSNVKIRKDPEFPSGIMGLYKYISNYTIYPSKLQKSGIKGNVDVKFNISKTGKVDSVIIEKSLHPLIDKEPFRLIKTMPKWKAAELNGEKINTWLTLPIHFEQIDIENDTTCFYVEKMPEFPGGELGLRNYISRRVKYPDAARELGIEGRVFVRFVVTSNGKVSNVTLARGVHNLLDEEAIFVVKNLPNWKPGEQKGEKVNVWYIIPINFSLK